MEKELKTTIIEIRALLNAIEATSQPSRQAQHFKEIRLLADKAERTARRQV